MDKLLFKGRKDLMQQMWNNVLSMVCAKMIQQTLLSPVKERDK